MIVIYALGSAHESQWTSFLGRNSHVGMGRAKINMSDLIDVLVESVFFAAIFDFMTVEDWGE